MVIIVKQGVTEAQLEPFISWLSGMNLTVHRTQGDTRLILGLVGDTANVNIDMIRALDIVQDVKRIQEPYKNASRHFHPDDTVIDVAGVKIGGGAFVTMAGPCSVESEEQLLSVARSVQEAGAQILRGGAFKPRSSPYAFQGLRAEGIRLLLLARKEVGLPIVTEIVNVEQLPLFEEVDIIQVGARNMQNFELLKELGRLKKPILLKRGLANTLEELLMSAEYLMAGGNEEIMLCERGIRTFESYTRNTLDLSAVPLLQTLSHLPVIVDPSHATGKWELVPSMSLAATAAGADGLIIEVHNDPPHALCDGAQSLTPKRFAALQKKIQSIRDALLSGEE